MSRILLEGGLIADGSGAQPFIADLLLDGGRIEAIGTIPRLESDEIFECRGLVVSPGFIDLHSHSDLQVLEGRREKTDQGVTTEVVGNCGFSAYPGGQRAAELREFANGIFCGDESWHFPAARDYLAAAVHTPLMNACSLVGHGSLRIGLFGSGQAPLSAAEMDTMEGVLDDAVAAGACGFSTGLMYAPGSGVPVAEIERLCAVVARRDALYATHMRSYSFGLEEAVEEQLTLARNAGCRLQISHLQAVGRKNWDKQHRVLERIEKAREDGIDVEFDIYPYIAGSTVLTQFLPQWALDGGTKRMLERLANRDERRRIAEDARKQLAQRWCDVVITSVQSSANQALVGSTVEAIAQSRSADPAETVMDLVAEEKGAVNIVSFNQSEDNLRELLTHPLCSVISDGFYVNGLPHPRLYGTFPQLLGEVSRERKWMPLAEAIHKITAKPAARLRLRDRGMLRPGAAADVTVFDPENVAGPATYESPKQAPHGIRAVFRGGRRL